MEFQERDEGLDVSTEETEEGFFSQQTILHPLHTIKKLQQTDPDERIVKDMFKEVSTDKHRIFLRNGRVNIVKQRVFFQKLLYQLKDPFHSLLNTTWSRLILYIWMTYVLSWLTFTIGYWYCPQTDECLGTNAGYNGVSFSDAFLFSVQTQTTIGYGTVYPTVWYTHMVFLIQCLYAGILDALCFGILYAKFARPNKIEISVLFSKVAIIANREGSPHFLFRIANLRKKPLASTQVKLYLSHDAQTMEGEHYIKFTKLSVDSGPLLGFAGYPFVVYHAINEESPLYGLKELPKNFEVIAFLEAVDISTAKSVLLKYSYTRDEISFGGKYADIVSRDKNGNIVVSLKEFHDIVDDHRPVGLDSPGRIRLTKKQFLVNTNPDLDTGAEGNRNVSEEAVRSKSEDWREESEEYRQADVLPVQDIPLEEMEEIEDLQKSEDAAQLQKLSALLSEVLPQNQPTTFRHYDTSSLDQEPD